MNALWQRADNEQCLTDTFAVLIRELVDMTETKTDEVAKFGALSNDPIALLKYQKDSGLTCDVCERILQEVKRDLEECRRLHPATDERNAIDGERALKTLYRRGPRVATVWTGKDGQKPVDLIVVHPSDVGCLLGDCKFGLKSSDAWLLRDRDQFNKEFLGKTDSVARAIKSNDGVCASSEMLFVVTSSLVELLKNRIDDYRFDSRCEGIPYEHIHVCSVRDIESVCEGVLG